MKRALLTAFLLTLGACTVVAQEQRPSTASTETSPDEVYRIGGNVKPPKPAYTPDPKRPKDHPRGSVWLSCVIGSDGKVRQSKVTRSLTPEADASALDVVKKWKFEPATKDGQPVAVQMNIEMGFR